jgi:hypothetical protein
MALHPTLARLAEDYGIITTAKDFTNSPVAMDAALRLAADAQPDMVTTSNAGIPFFLSNYMDPKLIQILTTPNKAAQILGEVKKGDWVTRTATFSVVESVGTTASYGDFSETGMSNANATFPSRQSFHYQTITTWGEKQLAEAGLAKIDWAGRLNISSALTLDKAANNIYFYGVQGLANYGLLTDPALYAPIAPSTKAAGGTAWAGATPNEIYADVQALYRKLVLQSGGIIEGGTDSASGVIDQNTKLVLATTPDVAIGLSNKNDFGLSVYDMLKSTFPNIRFETAIQYSTPSGNLAQIIAEEVEGQETGYCAFTEKMRAHPIVTELSSFKQKKSQGAWGAIIFLPFAIAQMLGI